MNERTTDEVAKIFRNAGDNITLINGKVAKSSLTDPEKVRLKRNVDHLEIIKTYKKEDNTTSIWTDEDFTDIDAAIAAGNSKLSA